MDLRDQLKNLFPEHEEQDFEMPEEKFEQKNPLICKFEKKGRNGKPVTLIEGFEGTEEELKQISKKIKITLGIGEYCFFSHFSIFFLMMQIYEISRHRIILFKGDIYQYLKYF